MVHCTSNHIRRKLEGEMRFRHAKSPRSISTHILPCLQARPHRSVVIECGWTMAAKTSGDLRRRRPPAADQRNGGTNKKSSKKSPASAAPTDTFERKKSTLRSKKFPIIPFASFLVVVGAILYSYYHKYGISMFVDRSYFDLRHTAAEWRDIMSNKTVLLLGGPHRAGTTILWKAISAHPDISGFGTTQETGVDESEGILLQDVYSRYGIGMEDIMKRTTHYQKKMLGVGRYALGDESDVHLTETDPRVMGDNMAKILNRFGQHWNLSQPVLIEKSPPTIVMSRFLQALYHADDDGGSSRSTSGGGPKVKFLFITRHPIANMMAHENMVGQYSHLTYDILMRNYIQMHRYLLSDLPHLNNEPMIIKLEEFAADPSSHLSKIYEWLGVDGTEETVKNVLEERLGVNIWSDPNANYRTRWCGKAEKDMPAFKRDAIVGKYQTVFKEELGELGYDLKTWCDETT